MSNTCCCFTGHRKLPPNKIEDIVTRLSAEIDRLIGLGVTEFMAGGALGFDHIASAMIIAKREMGQNVRLILALPCRDQDKHWTAEQKQMYQNLLSEADEIRYISEEYSMGCMKKRNRYMVSNSAYCICALLSNRSGTGQTVRYARQKGVAVINVAD